MSLCIKVFRSVTPIIQITVLNFIHDCPYFFNHLAFLAVDFNNLMIEFTLDIFIAMI